MKRIYHNAIVLLASAFLANIAMAQQYPPNTENAFKNEANFPTIPGDAMEPSRTNYYRSDNYTYTKKTDGSLYLTTGGWGTAVVNSNGDLVNVRNFNTTWDMTADGNQFQNGFFRLYTNLKLTPTNPTPNTTTSDLKTMRRNTSDDDDESFPYFKSYADINGEKIYNWQVWLYPIKGNQRFVSPKKANELRNLSYGGTAYIYRDYNYETLRDDDPTNDLVDNANDQNYELDLSANSTQPTQIFTRINNNRDKLILSIWYGYQPLAATASKPLADLRIANWDEEAYTMYYKMWFNGLAAVTPSGSNNEYEKIRLANVQAAAINQANEGKGEDIRKFNKKFDSFSDLAEDIISGGTEAALELDGVRTIAYAKDIDSYGKLQNTIQLKFRMLSVGMTYNFFKLWDRLGSSEAYRFNSNGINYFHPKHPFGLTQEHYIDIVTTRPSIAFPETERADNNLYLATEISMRKGENILTPLAIIINEDTNAYLPFQELEPVSNRNKAEINADNVRVSLVKREDYIAAQTAASQLSGYHSTNNPMPNNDLPVVQNFAYLTQQNFVASQANIPVGKYYLKYDYFSSDSSQNIKTEGDQLGNVFAKSIYRPFNVLNNSVSRVNPNLRIRTKK